MNRKQLFIFDLDGTLVDAYRAIEESLNFTLAKLGSPPVSYWEVKKNVGRGDKVFMQKFFGRNYFKKALRIYRAHHKKSLLVYSKLKPHARDVLGTLKRRKKIIAIASNRPKYFTDLILKKLGIKKYFNIVLCADEINSKKPTPKILNTIAKRFSVDKNDAVYIGDMNIDLETAQRAHIDALFITGGSSTLREVRKYRNKKVLFDLKEILKLYC